MGLVKLNFFVNFIERGSKETFMTRGGGGVGQKVIFDDERGRGGKPKSDF